MKKVVVHYDEIALKGGRRRMFVRRLVSNIRGASAVLADAQVHVRRDRILVGPLPDDALDAARRRLADQPGVSWCAVVEELPTAVESLERVAEMAAATDDPPASFRVRSRRANKDFPMNSLEIEREVGRLIQARTDWPVDLENAERTIYVDVSWNNILTYRDKLRGFGGLPAGSLGTVVALLSGGIDSPVAAFKMICRGCRAVLVHFHNFSPDSPGVRRKLLDLAKQLARYQPVSRLYLVPFAEVQADLVAAVPPRMRMVAYRRAMLRLATPILEQEKGHAFIVGDSVGQVASQTLENLQATYTATKYPVFPPLIGDGKLAITGLARRIGTYETSIEPYEDCCQLLLARSPETRCTPAEIADCEQQLPVDRHHEAVRRQTEVHEVVFERCQAG